MVNKELGVCDNNLTINQTDLISAGSGDEVGSLKRVLCVRDCCSVTNLIQIVLDIEIANEKQL